MLARGHSHYADATSFHLVRTQESLMGRWPMMIDMGALRDMGFLDGLAAARQASRLDFRLIDANFAGH